LENFSNVLHFLKIDAKEQLETKVSVTICAKSLSILISQNAMKISRMADLFEVARFSLTAMAGHRTQS
jgi:hypothetical protein